MVNMQKQDSCELFCNLQTISCLALSGQSPVSSTLTMMVMMMITLEDGDDQDEQGDINCGNKLIPSLNNQFLLLHFSV